MVALQRCRRPSSLPAASDAPSLHLPLLLLQGMSPADQAEVEANKLAVYLNLAAVHMAVQVDGWGVGGGRWGILGVLSECLCCWQ